MAITAAVERAYYAAQRADDRYQAALDKAGISRWSGKSTPAVTRAKRAKIRADERYHKAVEKQRANPAKKKRTVKILGYTVTVGTKRHRELVQDKKRYDDLARSEQGRGNPMAKRRKKTSRRGLNLNPLRKVMKEAGTKKVRVMRSKSGKPTGVKFL